MADDADHVVLTLPRGERGELRLSRSRYQGFTFTKFQIWYPTDDGELRPGRQVVTIRDSELDDVLGALGRIAAKIAGAKPGQTRAQKSNPKVVDTTGRALSPEDLDEVF